MKQPRKAKRDTQNTSETLPTLEVVSTIKKKGRHLRPSVLSEEPSVVVTPPPSYAPPNPTAVGWKRHHLCPDHGRQYLLLTDLNHPSQVGLCAHPTCIDKIISGLLYNSLCGGLIRFARKLDKDRGENYFPTFIVEQLLVEAQKGKPTICNPWFMRWSCLKFLLMLRKEEDREKKHALILKEVNELLSANNDEATNELLAYGSIVCANNVHHQYSPERQVALAEITRMSSRKWGIETHVWLSGDLNDLDYMKITRKTFKELKELRIEWKKWYRTVTNEFYDIDEYNSDLHGDEE